MLFIQSIRNHTARQLNLISNIRLRLLIQPILLPRHLEVIHRLLMRNYTLLKVRVTRTRRLNPQLDFTAPIHQSHEEARLVDRVANSDDSMVNQQRSFAFGAQYLGNLLTLLLSRYNADIFVVDAQYAIEVAHVLRDHLEGLAESAPGAAGNGVGVADGVDVVAGFVDFGVDVVAWVIGRTGLLRQRSMLRLRCSCDLLCFHRRFLHR